MPLLMTQAALATAVNTRRMRSQARSPNAGYTRRSTKKHSHKVAARMSEAAAGTSSKDTHPTKLGAMPHHKSNGLAGDCRIANPQ
jgi:hypothetical protein